MADKHVLTGGTDGYSVRVAFHIPIPDVTNEAGLSYRSLIADNEDTASEVHDISQTEQDALNDGSLWEAVVAFNLNMGHSTADNKALLDALYTETVDSVQAEFQNKYKYYGLEW